MAVVGALIDIALGIGLAVLRTVNAPVGQCRAEGLLPTVALAVLVLAPGLLALAGAAIARPALFAAAAIACLPLAFLSIAAVPLWLPAILFMVAFSRGASTKASAWLLAALLVAGFFVVLLVVALGMLTTGMGQYSYTYSGGSEGGGYFLPGRAIWSMIIVTADLVVATLLAQRQGQ